MKKIFTLALVALATVFGSKAEENYAPAAGDFSVEIKVNPFSNNFQTFKLDALQGRYFFTGSDALRFGIGFGVDSKKNNGDIDDSNIWTKTTNGNLSINLGYEKHFLNYKRVDLYGGAGLGFTLNTVTQTNNLASDKKTVTSNASGSYNEFAVKAFTGIDFYLYKGLYVGAELGLKLGVKSFPGTVVKGGMNNGSWSNSYEVSKGTSSSSFVLATYAEPALRLGWRF